MDRSATIKLISETFTTDSIGQRIPTETETRVFASVEDVSASEFVNAGQLGLKPAVKFTVFSPEYAGQRIVEYDNTRYGVYRTYRAKGERTELYCERKIGYEAVATAAGD